MDIICARHGNTFAPGERVVWVGRFQDLPLASSGEEQAKRLAAMLAKERIVPSAIFCAPLQRTRRHAAIVSERLGLKTAPNLDERLTEIDYGDWAGLTNEEVETKLHQGDDQRNWYDNMAWPKRSNWGGSETEIRAGVDAFLGMLRSKFESRATVLVVSSNGILRYFAMAAAGAEARSDARFPFKMRTGNFGILRDTGDKYVIVSWDVAPGGSP